MVREDAFRVEGAVTGVISPTKYWARLPNGHRVLAHVPGRFRLSFRTLAPGDKVRLEMSPFDLSAGRIIVPETENNAA